MASGRKSLVALTIVGVVVLCVLMPMGAGRAAMLPQRGSILVIYVAPKPDWQEQQAVALAMQDVSDWYARNLSGQPPGYSSGELDSYFFSSFSRLKDFWDRMKPQGPQLNLAGQLYIPFDPAMTVNPLEWLSRKMESMGYPNYAGDHLTTPSGFSFLPYGYLFFVRGLDITGTTQTVGQVRMAILGDLFLNSITNREALTYDVMKAYSHDPAKFDPLLAASRDGQHGALAHEIMHLLGWIRPVIGKPEHENLPGDSIHFDWPKFPNLTLAQEEKDLLGSAPWNIFFH